MYILKYGCIMHICFLRYQIVIFYVHFSFQDIDTIKLTIVFFQLRRPNRPHDVALFDPGLRSPKGRVVSFREADDTHLTRSLRYSELGKERLGEKLIKRALTSEGLGR